MNNDIKIKREDPYSSVAIQLMNELSASLELITGDSGRNSFDPQDVCIPRSIFVIAYDQNGEPAGCRAIRPISGETAELKRMYSRIKGKGIGTYILSYLENQARNFGYSAICLETRKVNLSAVSFYKSRGYYQISNYGKYANNDAAVCFEKKL